MKETKEIKPCFGVINFERRKHPRFTIHLPVEYWPIDKPKSRPIKIGDISEGGLLLYLPDAVEVGENLRVKLFIGDLLDLKSIEALVEVAWRDFPYENGEYRIGAKILAMSSADLRKLKTFLKTLVNFEKPPNLEFPPRLLSDLGIPLLEGFSRSSLKDLHQE